MPSPEALVAQRQAAELEADAGELGEDVRGQLGELPQIQQEGQAALKEALDLHAFLAEEGDAARAVAGLSEPEIEQ